MSEINKEIVGVYEELKGVLASIQDANSWFDDKGFTLQVNKIINRVKIVCPEIYDIDTYIIKIDNIPNRGPIVNTSQVKSKLNALVGRLKGTYHLDVLNTASGHTTVQFIQNQTQNQTLLEKLKANLPTIKNITDILSLVLKIGNELGLDPATIHKLLNL